MNLTSTMTPIPAQAAVSVSESADSGMPGWLLLVIVLAVLVLPFVIGQLIANALKVKDLGFKMGVTLFAITLGLAPFVVEISQGNSWRDAIPLGIDLAGGTNLVYEVDYERAESLGKEFNAETMDRVVGAVARRINPGGTEEVTVRQIPPDRIEVIVPGADPEKVERIKERIVELGSLEFALLANQFEHPDLIEQGNELPPDEHLVIRNGRVIAKWRPVGRDPMTGELKEVEPGNGVAMRMGTDGRPEFLVVVDPDPKRRITGELLVRAYEEYSPTGLAVGFQFNQRGSFLFRDLTARHAPKPGAGYKTRLAILLSDEIHSAPVINEMISGRGQISGDFTEQEVEELTTVLNAGALDLPLKETPINEFSVSPTLGLDIQEKGKTAIIWGAIVVFVFMLAYYWVAGAIADFCLAVNIILVVGTMALIDATFTLPGLAGLVLTIGMAVDANVLIFERIREEQDKGSSLRLSIQNGFGKALSTIVDANVTTLITAVVLYVIGTDTVKGFAVVLFIGIIMSMFSTLYVGRLFFDVIERRRALKRINMYGIVRNVNWNFLSKKQIAAVCSLVVIAGGMATVIARGSENLDIDFRGGAMVTFRFTEENEPTVDDVRAALEEQFEESITLERLEVDGPDGETEVMFRLRTTDKDEQLVSERINTAFADSEFDLVRQHVAIGEITPIPTADEGEDGDAPAAAGEFAGGYEVTLTFSEPMTASGVADEAADALRNLTEDGESRYPDAENLVEAEGIGDPVGESKFGSVLLRIKPGVSEAHVSAALAGMQQDMEAEPLFEEKNTFDSAVAGETRMAALGAMLVSLLAIVGYLWFRFQGVTFGLAAVAALVHDVLCVLGLVALGAYLSGSTVGELLALEDFKINLPIIAAFLTIVGYSLNDTIVVFDRIREVRGKNPALTEDMVNRSLNQTLSRTLLTSFTTFIVVFILYAIGGEGIHGFAYCLLLGILVGTYSSIYVASPVLVWLMNREGRPSLRPA